MTEKRFILAFEDYDGWAICDTTGEYSNDEDYIDWLSGEKAVDVMNHFAEENEQLKKLYSILKEKIQFYEDQVINPECPICHTILREISIDSKKDRYYRKCSKCGYEREESLI